MQTQTKSDSLKLWDCLGTCREDHLRTFRILHKDKLKRTSSIKHLSITLSEKCVICHCSSHQQRIGQNSWNLIMSHRCTKASLRKDSCLTHRRLASRLSTQPGPSVHHQFTGGLPVQMIDSIPVCKDLNIREIMSLLIYSLTQHCRPSVVQWANTTSHRTRHSEAATISSSHIRPRNSVKGLALWRLKGLQLENKAKSCSRSPLRSGMVRTRTSSFVRETVHETWPSSLLRNME